MGVFARLGNKRGTRMRERELRYYAYELIGIMKRTSNKKGSDLFVMDDFKLLRMNLISTSLATISLKSTQEVLNYIEKCREQLLMQNHRFPSYEELREELRPDQIFW